MKTREKTDQEKAKDRKEVRDLVKKLNAEAFELVQEFKGEWHCSNNINHISAGLVSKMLNIDSHALEGFKFRVTQSHVGDAFTENTTWKGYYPWLKLS
jgi:hypothetical protein